MRRQLRTVAAALALVGLLSGVLAVPAVGAPATWVVDDDRAQCAKAEFTSIGEAVADERVGDGDLIRVCPGEYTASVAVSKSVTIKGDPAAIDAIDCFQPSLPVDPAFHAIVDPVDRTATATSFGLKLQADGIDVSGLVFQDGYLGIDASDAFSGYRIHHNLFRSHAYFGVEFGSSGATTSRADHNCFWENAVRVGELGGGLGSELDDPFLNISLPTNRTLANARDLSNARIDHNETFRNNEALTAFGPGLRDAVAFDHNGMRDDRIGIVVQHAVNSSVTDNDVAVPEAWPVRPTNPAGQTIATSPIAFGGGNVGLEVARNMVTGGRIAITFQVAGGLDVFPQPSRNVLAYENELTAAARHGFAFAPPPTTGIAAGVPSVADSTFEANSVRSNGFHGFLVAPGSTGNTFRANVADANGASGIYVAAGAPENTFVDNSMHGNGSNPANLPPLVTPPKVDARDDSWPANTWTNTACDTDVPAEQICVLP